MDFNFKEIVKSIKFRKQVKMKMSLDITVLNSVRFESKERVYENNNNNRSKK